MKVNLNTLIGFQFTDKAWAVYNALGSDHREALAHTLTLNGQLELPLWKFFHIFGPHINSGSPVARNNEIEILTTSRIRTGHTAKPLRKVRVRTPLPAATSLVFAPGSRASAKPRQRRSS